ncbi:hypothetical protein FO519_008008 [Halicephalobus sp. NKZ332]|nr:hypothetical protein FO519_008008 [Halicephalobus sp. NKZ332]
MNVVTSASTSSPQCFSQTNSENSPESGNDSMVGSVESVRDRSHLFLDPGSKRPSGFLNGLRRNLNNQNNTNGNIPTSGISMNISNSDNLSPMLQKDLLQIVNAVMSPGNQLAKSGIGPGNLIPETPTPTKILYPKQVTKDQQEFAEGFAKALKEVQAQNQFTANNLASPSSTNLLFPLLAALTPTLQQPNTLPGVSATSPVNPVANAIIAAALTPTPTQTQTAEQLFAAFASLAGTPTGVSPTTALPVASTTAESANPVNPASVTSSSGFPASNSSVVVPTSNPLMDNMFSNHPELNNFMTNFNQNVMPQHPQPLSQHNNIGYHQSSMQIPPQVQQPLGIKTEPGTNGYSMGQGNGICQPPPQMCPPSTSHHYSSHHHSSGSAHELDLSEQERRKLERKRARNRMAASKCRQRKIERIQQLEGEVQQERQRFSNLQQSISSLEKTVAMLQNELARHKNSGCSLEKSTVNLMAHINNLMNNNPSGLGIDTM